MRRIEEIKTWGYFSLADIRWELGGRECEGLEMGVGGIIPELPPWTVEPSSLSSPRSPSSP